MIIIVIAIVAVGFIGLNQIAQGATKEFTLDAERFQYSPDAITMNKGDTVMIKINNIDTVHGIRIPEFDVRGETAAEFIANKVGEFDFYCVVSCGDSHGQMKGRLVQL